MRQCDRTEFAIGAGGSMMLRWFLVLMGASGCGPDTCATGDADCFLSHLVLAVDGHPTQLVKLQLNMNTPVDLGRAPQLFDLAGPPALLDLATQQPDLATQSPKGPLGCFVDEAVRDLSGMAVSDGAMTVERCAGICAAGGYLYYGLQDASWCYCGNGYGAYGTAPNSDCYMPCAGNPSEVCGGYLRNSVYGVGGGGTSGGGTSGGGTSGGGTTGSAPSSVCTSASDADYWRECSGVLTCQGCTVQSCTCYGASSCFANYHTSDGADFACDSCEACSRAAQAVSNHCNCAGGVGSLPEPNAAPSIDQTPPPLMFTGDKSGEPAQPMDVMWHDPNGCVPTFCMSMCSPRVRCAGFHMCTHAVADGQFSGTWKTSLGYTAVPASTTDDYTLQIVPISAPGCQDPVSFLQNGGVNLITGDQAMPITGAGTSVAVTVKPQSSSSGPGTIGPTCSDYMISGGSCTVCSIQSCYDGSNGYYLTSDGGRYDCSGTNCQAAAQAAVSHCCPPPK
jgi:hypothetical protein